MTVENNIILYLEDGNTFEATGFGHIPDEPILSEIVFNTSMTGYQEVFSDPSYCDQSVVMTYPLIGNYGINMDDGESLTPRLKAVIVREYCEKPSNFRSRQKLDVFLEQHNICGVSELDTRMLTRLIRSKGSMKSLISSRPLTESELKGHFENELKKDQIKRVTTKTISHFPSNQGKRVVLVDFGYKKNILESLLKRGCDVIVVPYDTSLEKIRQFNPQGILLSNGPGDPKSIPEVLPVVKNLQEEFPLFAICMGHQILALANGAKTIKMKFGNRGGNHPVKDYLTNRVYMTSQNHGYCVDESSIKGTELEVTQVNLNDKSIEGLRHKRLKTFSVQYHPEACPGPNDTKYLFDEFISLLSGEKDA